MTLTDPVDIYCERLGADFWAEPLNAVTNASFLAVALWAFWVARNRHRDAGVALRTIDAALIALTALIGVGSFLFHTFANRWSEWADTLPIWSFVGLYIYAAVTAAPSTTAPKKWITGALVASGVGYVLFAMATGEAADTNAVDPLNGSGQYLPALAALLIVLFAKRRAPDAGWFAAATTAFVVSLFFRTFDMRWCEVWPVGTHFVWHLLNGLMIGFLLQARVRAQRPANAQTFNAPA